MTIGMTTKMISKASSTKAHSPMTARMAVVVGIFSFNGIEVIAVTSGETANPEKAIPAALRTMAVRLFLFYVLALTVVVAFVPWTETGATGEITASPFVRVFTYSGIAFLVFLAFRIVTGGPLFWTLLFAPFLFAPFALFILGVVWFLMALGAFTRDVAHIMASIVPILMFATPVFYTLDQVPPSFGFWLRFNIIGDYIEMLRAIALDGRLPNPFGYLAVAAVSYAVFLLGYQFFMRYKSVIVDVI